MTILDDESRHDAYDADDIYAAGDRVETWTGRRGRVIMTAGNKVWVQYDDQTEDFLPMEAVYLATR